MNHLELKRQQEFQLKILVDFDSFCKQNNLKYFMLYGTLLGAVRHKGFIPWDYDIDIAMTREEFERFTKVRDALPSHLSIWDVCYSDIQHAGLCRIMCKDRELGNVYIDIFILDYEKQNNRNLRTSIGRFLHFAKLSKNEKSILMKHFKGQPLKQAVVQVSKIVRFLLGGNANTERIIFKLRTSSKPTNYYFTLEDHIHLPVEYFQDPQLLDFDGYKLYAPSHLDELLTELYGNYLEIPPEGHKWLKEEGLE